MATEESMLKLAVRGNWKQVLAGAAQEQLESRVLPDYLKERRWFGGKARQIKALKILEKIPMGDDASHSVQILLMSVDYTAGTSEIYVLPLAFAEGDEADQIAGSHPGGTICRLNAKGTTGVLYDGVYSGVFCRDLLSSIAKNASIETNGGKLCSYRGEAFEVHDEDFQTLKPKVLAAEQSNTSVLYGKEYLLKLYRHPDQGLNPDLEVSRFLTEEVEFPYIPHFAGGVEYLKADSEPISICILQKFVPNQGDAWSYYLERVKEYYRKILELGGEVSGVPPVPASFFEFSWHELAPFYAELIGKEAIEFAALLGKRTAELHKALASGTDSSSFTKEPFSLRFQESVVKSVETLTESVLQLLRCNLNDLPGHLQSEAKAILDLDNRILKRLQAFADNKMEAMRIRIHGDYHLGQILFTGNDFVIIDFEGEPARSLAERRIKQSPLKDVAGMIRSFHYAAYLSLLAQSETRSEYVSRLTSWAELWYSVMAASFIGSYLDTVRSSQIVPAETSQLQILLDVFLIEKAVYELGYELNNRPAWVLVPIRGIISLVT